MVRYGSDLVLDVARIDEALPPLRYERGASRTSERGASKTGEADRPLVAYLRDHERERTRVVGIPRFPRFSVFLRVPGSSIRRALFFPTPIHLP